jgi:hypothetical protein
MILSLLAVAAREAERPSGEEAAWSPLFERRLQLGVQGMDEVKETPPLLALQRYYQPDQTVLSLNPVSFCAGSACLGSFCGGSACLLSKCAGSACVNSSCAGSGCAVSACLGSACATSLCVGSGCVGSGCVGSACLTCGAVESPQACDRG